MDYKEYLNLKKSNAFIELNKYYTQETFLDVLDVARKENTHSSFIRWMLNDKSTHGLGTVPLERLLETICLAEQKLYQKNEVYLNHRDLHRMNLFSWQNKEYLEQIKYGRYKIEDLRIKTEAVLDKKRRADIMLGCRILFRQETKYLVLLIENKIKSTEHTNQTKEYENAVFNLETLIKKMKELFDDDNATIDFSNAQEQDFIICCVFLNACKTSEIKDALNKKQQKSEKILPMSKQFIALNYQYLLDGVIEPIHNICINEEARCRFDEYIRCLGQARLEENNKDYLVMALSQKERNYARELWNHNEFQKVIIEIFNSLLPTEEFVLNKRERAFWRSLAYVYSFLLPEYEKIKEHMSAEEKVNYEQLKKTVENITRSSRKHIYEYKRLETKQTVIYQSFTENSIGKLCRDIIEDLAKNYGTVWNKKDAEKFRKKVQGFKANWLREVILFDDEVAGLGSEPRYFEKDFEYDNNLIVKGKYKTLSIEEFSYAFFSYLGMEKKRDKNYDVTKYSKDHPDQWSLEIVLPDCKMYVAKFWGADDLRKLSSLIQKEYHIKIDYK
ncbi:MAG: PD-(D/E)XK nuclease family protein [Eubacteriales bacterium]|nr:PD-(D/E)XK nuclease family protein [Eubacteriales bacterium]